MRSTIVVLVCLTGCGGGAELTCDELGDAQNCWARAAAAAAACIPARATPATLAADRSSCTFSDGARVVFDAPLPANTMALDHLTLTLESGGAPCATFTDTFHNRMELEAGGHRVISQLQPDRTFVLDCGDEKLSTSFDTLFTCRPPAVAPTDGFEVTATTMSFTIVSVATPGMLFQCK